MKRPDHLQQLGPGLDTVQDDRFMQSLGQLQVLKQHLLLQVHGSLCVLIEPRLAYGCTCGELCYIVQLAKHLRTTLMQLPRMNAYREHCGQVAITRPRPLQALYGQSLHIRTGLMGMYV